MPRLQSSLESGAQQSAADMLLDVVNDANRIFAGRHNWLSPVTSDEERKQFIWRCCQWWNCFVCRAWTESEPCGTKRDSVSRFPNATARPRPSRQSCLIPSHMIGVPDGEARNHPRLFGSPL